MSRVIKFRAWDRATKHMSPSFHLFGEFTLLGAVHDWQHEMGHTAKTSLEALGSLEVMQCIGAKDRNEKDVYEGDIIVGFDDKVHLWVEYSEEDAAFLGVRRDSTGKILSGNYLNEGYLSNFKVIGNIYEHKHLLK